jgi:hypothetical protein
MNTRTTILTLALAASMSAAAFADETIYVNVPRQPVVISQPDYATPAINSFGQSLSAYFAQKAEEKAERRRQAEEQRQTQQAQASHIALLKIIVDAHLLDMQKFSARPGESDAQKRWMLAAQETQALYVSSGTGDEQKFANDMYAIGAAYVGDGQ